MTTLAVDETAPDRAFRHEALLYHDESEMVTRAARFIADGVERGDAVLTVVARHKIDRIRAALGSDADRALWADMSDVGRNPACIIQAWRDFVDTHGSAGRQLRGIGEPITVQRGEDELIECHTHEALLNRVFAHAGPFWLVCPYDVTALSDDVLRTALANHPFLTDAAGDRPSADYHLDARDAFSGALPPAPADATICTFDGSRLGELRRTARTTAQRAGLDEGRVADFVLAVTEVATNSVVHGGGTGRARLWADGAACTCDIEDGGRIADPMVGRLRPRRAEIGGYGLWLANHLCDLVQIRSTDAGSTVRIRVRATH